MSRNGLPVSISREAHKVERTGAFRSKTGVRSGHSRPLRMPQAKIAQVQALLIQGHSQRTIGRTLHISPMTVKKITKTKDFQAAIWEVREQIFGRLEAILESMIAGALADPYLAYRILKDFGVIPHDGATFLMSLKKMTPTPEQIRAEEEIRHIAAAMSLRHRQYEAEKNNEVTSELSQKERECNSVPERDVTRETDNPSDMAGPAH